MYIVLTCLPACLTVATVTRFFTSVKATIKFASTDQGTLMFFVLEKKIWLQNGFITIICFCKLPKKWDQITNEFLVMSILMHWGTKMLMIIMISCTLYTNHLKFNWNFLNLYLSTTHPHTSMRFVFCQRWDLKTKQNKSYALQTLAWA